MTNSIGHAIIIYTFIIVIQVGTSLRWVIQSKYIVYGEDVLLNCDGTACSSNSIKKWIGGPHHDLLCFNVTSSYPSKYEMMLEDKSPNFGLKIKNFTNDDINCKYTCACGLHQYTHMLDLDAGKYIYPPRVLNYSNLPTEDGCDIDFVIEVYPLPRCFIVRERDEDQLMYNVVSKNGFPVNFTSVPNFYNNSVSRMNKLLRTQQSIKDIKNSSVSGNIYLTCTFDFIHETVFRQKLTMCNGDHRDNKKTTKDRVNIKMILIAAVIVIGCVVLPIIIICVYRWKSGTNMTNNTRNYTSVVDTTDVVKSVSPLEF